MNGPDTEWTEQDRAALAALREDASARPELERRVLRELVRRRLLAPAIAPRGLRAWLAAAIAAGVLFALGVFVGSRTDRRTVDGPGAAAPRYVLFLEGAATLTREEEARRVDEYRSWARLEAAAGRLLSGEKLEPQVQEVGGAQPLSAGSAAVRGFFIVTAGSDAEALAIARGCPHVAHGGRVILRRIAVL